MTGTHEQRIGAGGRVLVTGASGFVGRMLCDLLLRTGYRVRGSSRAPASPAVGSSALEWAQVGALSAQTDWSHALQDVDAVVHLAARVHQPRERAMRAAALHHRTNCEGTVRLAEMSAAAGVRRLVFLSTVKVNGKRTVRHADGSCQRYSEDDVPHPQGAYAQSKWEAEQALLEIAARAPMAVTILRPPLVYGPGVGANFLRLVRAVQKGVPLPFARVVNMRSLVYVENLAEAILVCMESKAAANKTYLVGDVEVSTPDLIDAVARVLGCRPRLIRMPLWALRLGGVLTLRSAAVSRLLDSLLIDDSRIRRELFWTPSMTMQQGLARTAAWLGVKAPEPGHGARRAPGTVRS